MRRNTIIEEQKHKLMMSMEMLTERIDLSRKWE